MTSHPPNPESSTQTLDGSASSAARLAAPERLGAYRLLQRIGIGGTSEVYLAERDDEQFHQKVAIKLIAMGPGADTRESRFRAERQILARLEHPNIARLYDGGEAPDGRLHFVLEHVDGLPINLWCRDQNLPLRGRLELFCQVCSAVSYAHQNLIVHRDIKPANILVTQDGVPKLLDFGIAKILEPEGFPQVVEQTTPGQAPMTPQYASPEQIRGESITTATDIYALGLLLYELLSDQRPYELRGLSVTQMEWEVCEKEPPKPSTVLATGGSRLARSRGLVGDLDNIVLKALAKDPTRRYASSRELVDDIVRYLGGRPVLATSPTWRYRTGRFLRRHAVAASVTVLFCLFILLFLALLAIQSGHIAAERDQARVERDRAERISQFLADVFVEADPNRALGRAVTAEEILQKGADRVRRDLDSQPLTQARLMTTIGTIDRQLGLYAASEALLESAVEIYARELGERSLEVASSLDELGVLYQDQSRYEPSIEVLNRAIEIRREILGAHHLDVTQSYLELAHSLRLRGDAEEARELLMQALEIRRQHLGGDHPEVAEVLMSLALLLRQRGEMDDSGQLFLEALQIRQRHLSPNHPELADSLDQLANHYYYIGELDQAAPLYQQVYSIREHTLGEDHPDLAGSLNNLSLIHSSKGEYDLAEEYLLKAHSSLERSLGPRHLHLALLWGNLGTIYLEQGKLPLAEEALLKARDVYNESKTPQYFATFFTTLARLYRFQGKYQQAEQALLRSVAIFEEQFVAGEHSDQAVNFHDLALLFLAQGQKAEAEAHLERAESIATVAVLPKIDDPESRLTMARIQFVRGELLWVNGQDASAKENWRRALATIEPLAKGSEFVVVRDVQVKALLRLNRLDEARPIVERLWRKGWRNPAFVELSQRLGLPPTKR